jgi:energy-coupling factor transport system ATP-binding protein
VITLRSVRLDPPCRQRKRPGSDGGEDLQQPLLDDISLEIRFGEYVALVGANGAGKSLLLQVMAGLRRATAGEYIFVNANESVHDPDFHAPHIDKDISESASRPLQTAREVPAIGIVFQNPDDQLVGSTVERDIAFGLENISTPPREIRRRVDEALALSGLEDHAARPPHLLSEGEKQRLALAAVLALRPRALLLDEPTSRLDAHDREVFLTAVERARRETGAAVVQVSHRSEEVVLADRVLGLEQGRLTFAGSVADFLQLPGEHPYGVMWSGPHQLLRELSVRGVEPPRFEREQWNDAQRLLGWLAPT